MFIPFRYRQKAMAANKLAMLCGLAALAIAANAFALKSDRDQQMLVDANAAKSVESKTETATDPDLTDLDGNVVMTQGSIKIRGDHATIYRMPKNAKNENAGKVVRAVITGKQARMQQVHDGDCGLMTTNANKIDYNPITYVAELSGGVVVDQAGRGEFHGEHMLYNTDTGDMESGDKSSPAGRVHLVMEPKTDKPAPSANNCGFPASAAPKPAAKPAGTKSGGAH